MFNTIKKYFECILPNLLSAFTDNNFDAIS
jgi:hypothetical protein